MKNIFSFYRYAANCYASCRYVMAIVFILTLVGCSHHEIREPVKVNDNKLSTELNNEEDANYKPTNDERLKHKRISEETLDHNNSVAPESVQAPSEAKVFENLESRVENDAQKATQAKTKPEKQDQRSKALQELYSVDKPKKDPSLGEGSSNSEERQQLKNEQKNSKQKSSKQKNNEASVNKSPSVQSKNNLSSKKTKLDEKLADDNSRLNKTEEKLSGDSGLKKFEGKAFEGKAFEGKEFEGKEFGDKSSIDKELEDKAEPKQQKLKSQVEALSFSEGEKNELEDTKSNGRGHTEALPDEIGRHEKASHSYLTHEGLDHSGAEYAGPHVHEGYFHDSGDHKKRSKPRWNLQRQLK